MDFGNVFKIKSIKIKQKDIESVNQLEQYSEYTA